MRPLVLMYHRVNTLRPDPWNTSVSPAHFEEHLQVIRTLPERPQITFDDGYADNIESARPLLEKWDLPATIFVVSGAAGSPYEMWWDELDRKYLGSTPADWDWSAADPDEGAMRYRAAFHRYREKPFAIFEERPLARPERRMMTQDEVARLAATGFIEIGAHTVSHPVLSSLPAQEQQREIVKSKRDLETITGKAVKLFAYPNGFPADYTAQTVAICRAAGFDRAFAAWDAPLQDDCNAFEIPRMMVRDWDGDQFAARLRERFR